jgi:hypothetical protein
VISAIYYAHSSARGLTLDSCTVDWPKILLVASDVALSVSDIELAFYRNQLIRWLCCRIWHLANPKKEIAAAVHYFALASL